MILANNPRKISVYSTSNGCKHGFDQVFLVSMLNLLVIKSDVIVYVYKQTTCDLIIE